MTARTLLIIVSTNDGHWLGSCLEALGAARMEGTDVLVVLNDCADESAAVVERSPVRASVVRTPERLGFAAANNIGIARACEAGYEYVYLLNPDTKVHPEAISAATEFLDANPEYGIAGSQQITYEDAGWDRPNGWTRAVLEEAAGLGQLPRRMGAVTCVDHYYVQGAAMMFRTDLVPAIGLLDPVYVTFYEETDFCRRCGLSGRKVALLLESRVKHFEGGNWKRSRRDRIRRDHLYLRNQFLYFLSGAPTWREGLRLAGPLLGRQLSSVARGTQETTLGLWRYPQILLSVLRRLPVMWRMRARNRSIRAGQPLAADRWAIDLGGRRGRRARPRSPQELPV